MRRFSLAALVLLLAALPVRAEDGPTADVLPAPAGPTDPVEAARQAWTATPDSIELGCVLQDLLTKAGREREAKSTFRRAQLRDRGSKPLAFLYGRVLGGRDGLRRMRASIVAVDELESATKGDRGAAWRALRAAEVDAGNWEAAESAARNVVELGVEAWDWATLGWIQERRGKTEDAIASYRLALRMDEKHLWTRNTLALLLAKAAKSEEAIALATETAATYPDLTSVHLHLGLVLCLAEKAEEGRAAYAQALRRANGDADALAAVAAAYSDLEEFELATQAVEQALALDPDHGQARVNAGVLGLERGDLKTARRHLERAARVRPKDPRVLFLLGTCYQRLEFNSMAVKAFRRAANLAPENAHYHTALAMAHAGAGAVDSAITAIQKALRVAPTDAELHLQLGFLLIKKRRWSQAHHEMEAAADLAPRDPRPWFYIAILRGDHLRRSADALRALLQYQELGGNEPAALLWLEELKAAKSR